VITGRVRNLLHLLAAVGVAGAAACGPSTPPATNPSPTGASTVDAAVVAAVDIDAAAPAPSLPDAATPVAASVDAGTDAPAIQAAVFVPTSCVSKTVSLATDVQPIMTQRCSSIEGCHGFKVRNAAGSYKFLVGAKSTECDDGRLLAKPGDPEHSYVIDKLVDRNLCKGDPMPKFLLRHAWTELPQADVQTVYDWICEGAPNN
jgi:hypothetical protein